MTRRRCAARADPAEVTMAGMIAVLGAGVVAMAVALWRSLNPPPALEISERGIRDRRLGLGWLDWDSIEGAYRPRVPDGGRVLLRVRTDDRLIARLGRRLRGTAALPGSVELTLHLDGTSYSEVDVLQEILAHRQAAAPETPPALDRLPC